MTTDIPNLADMIKDLDRPDREMAALLEAIDNNQGVECAQVPDVFYPEDFYTSPSTAGLYRMAEKTAREICFRCPVIAQCLRVGLREEYGIWGGTTPKQRSAIRRKRII